MRNLKILLTALFGVFCMFSAEAYKAPEREGQQQQQQDQQVSFRENCTTAQGRIDQAVNNVRARLNNGGDVWWDRSNGNYIVPKVANDETPVSSIYAGAVWLGGFDPGGNLKTACQTYGNSQGNSDFWAGPIDPVSGFTSKDTCDNWDRFWVVTKEEVEEHLFRVRNRNENGVPYTEDQIPSGVKGWPARGNPYFEEENLFSLPNTDQGLAGFWDEEENLTYDPLEGDYPIIEIRGCLTPETLPETPDEMIFWIYNDAGDIGNVHGETDGLKINMEVQVQAFAYARNDEINDMTFQRYKLINRADEDIDSTYFAMWVDADLGCADDDYVGCDTARELAYIYNADAVDGISGITCNGVPTYGTEIPIIGIDYFRGPLDEFRNEIGMSSFTYYNRGGQGQPPGTEDPGAALEYYNYLSGRWRDGSDFEFGGDGYQEGTTPINYAFPSPPDGTASTDWSNCSPGNGAAALQPLDRRTIQASGPFTLKPSAINELIIGVVWVPNQDYPCPSLNQLLFADETAQALFNNCFELNDGPDAPDVDWVELDREIVAVLSNDTSMFETNNPNETYFEVDAFAPDDLPDTTKAYVFEGYLLYQFAGPNVNISQRNDPSKVRLVAQVDVNNGVTELFNWSALEEKPDNITETIWIPNQEVLGEDGGIRHTFQITQDAFASGGDTRLINHKKYYYSALAYGYNEYQAFDPEEGTGQRRPFIAGGGNIGNGELDYYVVTPRPITDETLNSAYGQGTAVTRLDGVGIGGNPVDITDETRERMFAAGEADIALAELEPEEYAAQTSFSGIIDYKENAAPIEIQIYNPLEVRDGDYLITFFDEDMENDQLDEDVNWRLLDANTEEVLYESTQDISTFNEAVLADIGITVGIGQTADTGEQADQSNGAIDFQREYSDPNAPQWFNAYKDDQNTNIENPVFTFYNAISNQAFNFVRSAVGEALNDIDPFESMTNIGDGSFFPFFMANFQAQPAEFSYITPMWRQGGSLASGNRAEKLGELRNIDIVFTSDKSKWSRCVIVEMRTDEYDIFPTPTGAIATAETLEDDEVTQFNVRQSPSVGKEDTDGDGLPDPDGDTYTDEDGNTFPRLGMGWFPGYAIDVETGERLNIFFGENSAYAEENGNLAAYSGTQLDNGGNPVVRPTGRDMMFNPTDQAFLPLFSDSYQPTIYDVVAGGQHWIYVSNTRYDECEFIHARLDRERQPNPLIGPVAALRDVAWTGLPVLPEGQSMLSYANGLIPNDMIAKIRVDNPYQVYQGTGDFNGYPTYQFSLEGVQSDELTDETTKDALDAINVVPNPYYAFSDYENDVNENIVKVTNLPPKCVVTIYSLDGKFIRQYNRDELPGQPQGSGIPTNQIIPDIEWDLKNNKGIRISSGVYLIHVDATASGWGERTLKWFGINRKFDASGL